MHEFLEPHSKFSSSRGPIRPEVDLPFFILQDERAAETMSLRYSMTEMGLQWILWYRDTISMLLRILYTWPVCNTIHSQAIKSLF